MAPGADAKIEQDLGKVFSQRAYLDLRREFGVRFMPFFDLYGMLYTFAENDGHPPSEGWAEYFRQYSRLVSTIIANDNLRDEFVDLSVKLRPLWNRLDEDPTATPALIRRIEDLLVQAIALVAQTRDVYLMPAKRGFWSVFRVMSDKEQRLNRLRRDDPELYNTVLKSRDVMRTVDAEIQKVILESGSVPSRKSLFGRPVNIATDPVTGAETVYDDDGSVTPIEDFIEKQRLDARARQEQERVFPRDLDQLRKFTESEINQATGPVEYIALTDDKVKSGMTRIYPTRTLNGVSVVVEGRFKGFAVPDLVNASGRLIEGTAFDFDPKTGRVVPLELKNPDGSVNIRTTVREPYVTVDKGQLLLRIPSTMPYTEIRDKVKRLSAIIPTLKYVERSRKSLFTFDPKDFAAVREALGGMALSTAAASKIQSHFQELARHEMATAETRLQGFTAEAIGGFRADKRLLTKQKQALAWMESRGRSGVIALDTGLGKTVVAIAAMQKMHRDGIGAGTSNGRYLYVCPDALRGNLAKEAHIFLDDPKSFLDRVDVMSYSKFMSARSKNPSFGQDYIAVFFDEAQALKNPRSKTSKAAMELNHPRKTLLTASPMERSPMEVYALTAISNNINLNTREGRRNMQAFRARFAEEVGGRIIGMKDDPITSRDLRVWVKRNLYFADKRDVEELNMAQLAKRTDTVTMDPRVEAVYRETASGISGVLSGLVSKYRDRVIDQSTKDRALEAARIKLAGLFGTLTDLSNRPDKIVPGARNTKLDRLVQIVDNNAGSTSRFIVFTDSPDFAEDAVTTLVKRCPWRSYAVGLANKIEILSPNGDKLSFTERVYQKPDGTPVPKSEWKVFVMKEYVAKNPMVGGVVLTSTYAVGQNLQEFDTVIHLDRDTWNSETMKQRTARAWRQGQKNPVTEIILDTVYENPMAATDATLDQIRRYVQELDSDLFDRVVIDSQSEALGAEYFGMKRTNASFYKVNRRMMEMAMSPYLAQIRDL